MKTHRHLLIACASFLSLAAHGHALPDVKFDKSKSLGTWEQFVTSLGLQQKPNAVIFFDTDRREAGEFTGSASNFVGLAGAFGKEKRQVLRKEVGRVVTQDGGPEIVVYDFEEIYTIDAQNKALPSKILLLGRRPAAIVADGQISNWPSNYGNAFEVVALNSCNPDNPAQKAPSTARGGNGFAVADPGPPARIGEVGAGSGGYGSSGDDGLDGGTGRQAGLVPGRGGRARFSWDVLRPGSAGGDVIELWAGGKRYRGGAAGGAVWLKSGGRLDVHKIEANGGEGDSINLRWTGGGSGGHVIIESPEIPRVSYAHVRHSGAPGGGVGAVEFRGTPGMPDFPDYGYIGGGSPGVDVPVGLPAGISFSGREPKLTQNIHEVRRPRIPPPAVSARITKLISRQRSFTVDAAASAPAGSFPARIRYRLRPPGAEVFGPWFADELPPSSDRRKSWRKELNAPTEGKWQVEVVAEDNKGNRSTGKVAEVALDHTKPTVFLDAKSVIRINDRPGSYKLETFVGDQSLNQHAVTSGPARVEYRVKRPDAASFGKWTRFALGDKSQYPSWPSATVLVPVTLDPAVQGNWGVEMRAVDLVGNIGEAQSLGIRQ